MFSHASGLNNVVFWSVFSHDHCDLVFLNLISWGTQSGLVWNWFIFTRRIPSLAVSASQVCFPFPGWSLFYLGHVITKGMLTDFRLNKGWKLSALSGQGDLELIWGLRSLGLWDKGCWTVLVHPGDTRKSMLSAFDTMHLSVAPTYQHLSHIKKSQSTLIPVLLVNIWRLINTKERFLTPILETLKLSGYAGNLSEK